MPEATYRFEDVETGWTDSDLKNAIYAVLDVEPLTPSAINDRLSAVFSVSAPMSAIKAAAAALVTEGLANRRNADVQRSDGSQRRRQVFVRVR